MISRTIHCAQVINITCFHFHIEDELRFIGESASLQLLIMFICFPGQCGENDHCLHRNRS